MRFNINGLEIFSLSILIREIIFPVFVSITISLPWSVVKYILFLLPAKLSGFRCLFCSMTFCTWLVIELSFSVLEDYFVALLFEHAYRALYIVISYFYFHSLTANSTNIASCTIMTTRSSIPRIV